jgi:AcrR family transcriptional regulator
LRTPKKNAPRRQPKQERARSTVQFVLDATTKLLARDGIDAVTTNRIADLAGVSVGSIYQYFPDKRAIFSALHERHAEETRQLIASTVAQHTTSSLGALVLSLMDGLIDAHAHDPVLHELLAREIPLRAGRAPGLRLALHAVISDRAHELTSSRDVERTLFIVPNMMDTLAHEAVLARPPQLSLADAKDEAARAVSEYLRVAP